MTTHLDCDHVHLFLQQQKIAQHRRLFGQAQWSVSPFHYLDTLNRKLGAFDEARPIQAWKQSWPDCYDQLLRELRDHRGISSGTRQFIEVLKLQQTYPQDKVETAIQMAMEAGTYAVESIKMLLDERWVQQLSFPPLPPDQLPGITNLVIEPADLNHFKKTMRPLP